MTEKHSMEKRIRELDTLIQELQQNQNKKGKSIILLGMTAILLGMTTFILFFS